MPRSTDRVIRFARAHRHDPTKAEGLLWWCLRSRQLEHHFRRQVPIGTFIADFACLREKLIIEIDGEGHTYHGDEERDAWFSAIGFRTLRVFDDDVTDRMDDVIEWILMEIDRPFSVIDQP